MAKTSTGFCIAVLLLVIFAGSSRGYQVHLKKICDECPEWSEEEDLGCPKIGLPVICFPDEAEHDNCCAACNEGMRESFCISKY